MAAIQIPRITESSQFVRTIPSGWPLRPRWPRNIPTRVGKTKPADRAPRFFSEHPHACGENNTETWRRPSSAGTSPRVWGKLLAVLAHVAPDRNIPTRVGKTQRDQCTRNRTSEHPHACGENVIARFTAFKAAGTSPRVWGKHRGVRASGPRVRNIPTRVGKTALYASLAVLYSEHPHACGENATPTTARTSTDGTSPRVWGKRLSFGSGFGGYRNIPTRVGKTLSTAGQSCALPEHPHACGENCARSLSFSSAAGTSPRVWGKRRHVRPRVHSGRNIPTRVGKTRASCPCRPCRSEHPHACGENPRYWPQ